MNSCHPISQPSWSILHNESDCIQTITHAFTSHSSIIVVIDSLVLSILQSHHPKLYHFFTQYPICPISGNESSKSLKTLETVFQFMIDHGCKRSSALISIGGGSITDLSGFAAATYMRGIPYYTFPTTLLGMVDSGLGGKTSINFSSIKNLLGAFHFQNHTYIYPSLLQTLSQEQFSSGMAEVIKYSLLSGPSFFSSLFNTPRTFSNDYPITDIIHTCCTLKSTIVQKDPYEKNPNIRSLLNLGHTFGHAIESLDNTVHHGQAVAIGLYLAALYSQQEYGLSQTIIDDIQRLIHHYHLPTTLKNPLPVSKLLQIMSKDKKNTSSIALITLKQIGQATFTPNANIERIRSLWLTIGASNS